MLVKYIDFEARLSLNRHGLGWLFVFAFLLCQIPTFDFTC